MHRNWKHLFAKVVSALLTNHGTLTIPILRSRVFGFICTESLTRKVRRLISSYSKNRVEPAARDFFNEPINWNGLLEKVTMDKIGANKAGVNTINLALALLCMFGGLLLQMT